MWTAQGFAYFKKEDDNLSETMINIVFQLLADAEQAVPDILKGGGIGGSGFGGNTDNAFTSVECASNGFGGDSNGFGGGGW